MNFRLEVGSKYKFKLDDGSTKTICIRGNYFEDKGKKISGLEIEVDGKTSIYSSLDGALGQPCIDGPELV